MTTPRTRSFPSTLLAPENSPLARSPAQPRLRTTRPSDDSDSLLAAALLAAAVLVAVAGCAREPAEGAAAAPAPADSPTTAPNPQRNAYFGDLHVHTRFSFDAYIFNVRATPDDAYRFAKGEAISHPNGFPIQLQSGALDFQAVTDHDLYLGSMAEMDDPASALYLTALGKELRELGSTAGFARALAAFRSGEFPQLPADAVERAARGAWQQIVAAAEQHNQPGRFTTFAGYEYTASSADRGNLHRNVIFAGAAPDLPYSAVTSPDPETLWRYLDDLRSRGIEGLAIPHNSNGSNGHMFALATFDGRPLDAAYAETRMRNEPLVEITQVKGDSETHPLLSPNDEWADYEKYPYRIATTLPSEPKGSYVREAYLHGLVLEQTKGWNPFRFGLIGSTETHNGGGTPEEFNYHSKVGDRDGTAQQRGSVPLDSPREDGGRYSEQNFDKFGAAGLAGIWAEENTRASLYAALRRKETFATTGPRIKLRFFGGFDYPADLPSSGEMIERAYAGGVPMGSDLIARAGAQPALLIWAARDPNSAPLQRLQVIKGWVENGAAHEAVIDVACSDRLEPDPTTGRCPENGAKVNLADCSITQGVGAAELKVLWRDPDWDPAQRAFYYARVLENPTCRWSTWDAVRAGVPPREDLHTTIQERAYSSPIWISPGG